MWFASDSYLIWAKPVSCWERTYFRRKN